LSVSFLQKTEGARRKPCRVNEADGYLRNSKILLTGGRLTRSPRTNAVNTVLGIDDRLGEDGHVSLGNLRRSQTTAREQWLWDLIFNAITDQIPEARDRTGLLWLEYGKLILRQLFYLFFDIKYSLIMIIVGYYGLLLIRN
jgi:hypothetical protein